MKAAQIPHIGRFKVLDERAHIKRFRKRAAIVMAVLVGSFGVIFLIIRLGWVERDNNALLVVQLVIAFGSILGLAWANGELPYISEATHRLWGNIRTLWRAMRRGWKRAPRHIREDMGVIETAARRNFRRLKNRIRRRR